MAKPTVLDHRYDFRGGRNTAISPDLLNPNELVDATNARLSASYGGFQKRTGSQRIHPTALPAPIEGLTQWDGPNGKQVVAIANGNLYYRDGFDYSAAFVQANTTATLRSTNTQDVTDPPLVAGSWGWTDANGADDGQGNDVQTATNASQNVVNTKNGVLIMKIGSPHVDQNVVAVDHLYTLKFRLSLTGSGTNNQGVQGSSSLAVTIDYSTNSGGAWTSIPGTYGISVGHGTVSATKTAVVSVTVGAAPLWFRLNMTTNAFYPSSSVIGSQTSVSTVFCYNTTYRVDNFPATWTTGLAAFSTTQHSVFAPFRASTAGAPLVLYIASGGHYFKWTGTDVGGNGLSQLDGSNNAPTTTSIISYHTRMFAMTASLVNPGTTPKTIYWSVLGNAEDFTTGDKTKGGSAVTDFLTGQQLISLEVIGSSLLMATRDSVMRFTGQASDDIVIAENTEGISAEVGAAGHHALKRYENVAAMFTDRGPYTVTETYAEPSGEQLNPDWQALDSANLDSTSVEYHHGRKELWFAVPGANDGGTPKTVFVQAVRLQAWQGPYTYPFAITHLAQYYDANNKPTIISGGLDGFIRLMDVGSLDDVLFDGTGGSNITMTVEIPVIHFQLPGLKKALKWLILQADLPLTSTPSVKVAFDGSGFTNFPIVPNDNGEEDYRVDVAGDTSQGFRVRLQFTDNGPSLVTVYGFTLVAWNMMRTT